MSKLQEELIVQEYDEEENTSKQSKCSQINEFLKANIASGITVALISVPLSTALAIASGASPIMGLQAAIFGPMIAGLIGGSNYNVLGPAGALVNVLSNLVAHHGIQIIPLVAMCSGMIQMFIYAFQLQKFCILIPISVLEGFSFGVALTIGGVEIKSALGLKNLTKHDEIYMNIYESLKNFQSYQGVDFYPFLFFFLTLMILQKFFPGKPWIVLIAIFGILYGWLTSYFSSFFLQYNIHKPTLLQDEFPYMNQAQDFSSFSKLINTSYLDNKIPILDIFIGSVKIAFIGILETLIAARVADNLTGTRSNQSQEVLGLSIANIVCGILGATPCTGVLVRTVVNVASGATSKISQFINGVFVLLIVAFCLPYYSFIPMPVIASILITSAVRLIPFNMIIYLFKIDKFECFILLLTAGICIYADGAMGLMCGGLFTLINYASKSQIPMLKENYISYQDQIIYHIKIQGSLNYLNCQQLESKIIDLLPPLVVIELENLQYIDVDGLEQLQNIIQKRDIEIMSIALLITQDEESDNNDSILQKSPWFQEINDEQLVYYIQEDAYKFLISQSKLVDLIKNDDLYKVQNQIQLQNDDDFQKV